MELGLVSGDLMLASRLEGAAKKLGWKLVAVGSATGAAAWDRSEIAAVVIDLRTVGAGVGDFVAAWTAEAGAPPVVACGPHVQENLLAAARAAGCAAVVTRGQIDRDAERILAAVVMQS